LAKGALALAGLLSTTSLMILSNWSVRTLARKAAAPASFQRRPAHLRALQVGGDASQVGAGSNDHIDLRLGGLDHCTSCPWAALRQFSGRCCRADDAFEHFGAGAARGGVVIRTRNSVPRMVEVCVCTCSSVARLADLDRDSFNRAP
jgi:hypothetical protein